MSTNEVDIETDDLSMTVKLGPSPRPKRQQASAKRPRSPTDPETRLHQTREFRRDRDFVISKFIERVQSSKMCTFRDILQPFCNETPHRLSANMELRRVTRNNHKTQYLRDFIKQLVEGFDPSKPLVRDPREPEFRYLIPPSFSTMSYPDTTEGKQRFKPTHFLLSGTTASSSRPATAASSTCCHCHCQPDSAPASPPSPPVIELPPFSPGGDSIISSLCRAISTDGSDHE